MCDYNSLSLKGPGHKIRILTLNPGSKEERILFTLNVFPFEPPGDDKKSPIEFPYEVLEYYWDENEDNGREDSNLGSDFSGDETRDGEEIGSVQRETEDDIDEKHIKVDETLHSALRALRLETEARHLWIDSICVDRMNISEGKYQEKLKKHIYTYASKVLFWIGKDFEDSDCLNFYLGLGTAATTDLAFALARRVAYASKSEARSLIRATDLEHPKPSWCYLARLVYRFWFRRGRILRTNYLSDLNELDVLCGLASIPWSILSTAADRIRCLNPVPQIFLDIGDLTEGSKTTLRGDVMIWLDARREFGFEEEMTVVHLLRIISSSHPNKRTNLQKLLDIVNEEYELGGRAPETEPFDLARLKISDDASDSGTEEWGSYNQLPTLPSRTCLEVPPLPTRQLPFIHSPLRSGEIRLLCLVSTDLHYSEPLQCSLIHYQMNNLPPYTFVLNSFFGNKSCTSTILVDGQAFEIKKALEWFLRKMANRVEDEMCRHLFVWPICSQHGPTLMKLEDIELYRTIRNTIVQSANEVIDLCEEFDALQPEEVAKELDFSKRDITRGLKIEDKSSSVDLDNLVLDSSVYFYTAFERKGPHRSRYVPLDQFADEIRVLYILPHKGDESASLECVLGHVSLARGRLYEALSYTWGSQEDKLSISLDHHPFLVGRNLYDALLVLREGTGLKPMWVDAICMNQEDPQEKSREIKRMPKIYASAHAAILWLGKADEDSDLAMDFMNALNSPLLNNENSLSIGNKSALAANLDDEEKRAWVAIFKLFRREYFMRTWTVQEQAMAEQMCIVCGHKTTAWQHAQMYAFIIAANWNYFKTLHDESIRRYTSFFPHRPDTWFMKTQGVKYLQEALASNNPPTFLKILIANQETHATLPHDKIYGFWGLAKDASVLVPKIDYATSVQALFISLVDNWISHYRSLDIICTSQWRVPGTEGVDGLPTWVSDWTATWVANTFISLHPLMLDEHHEDLEHSPMYHASGNMKPITAVAKLPPAENNDQEITALAAAGLSVDVVKELGPECEYLPARPLEEWKAMLRQDKCTTEEEKEKIRQNFWRTMMAGRNPVGELDGIEDSLIATVLGFERFADDPDAPKINSLLGTNIWLDRVSNVIRARRFVITEKGHFGLVHRYVQEGDEICILLGCSVPVILRKLNSIDHIFLGDCYIDGYMDGEVIEAAGGEETLYKEVTHENFMRWIQQPETRSQTTGVPTGFFLL